MLGLLVLLAWLAADTELLEVPEPPPAELEPAVREQLASARAATGTDAEAWEQLGRLYLLYEFTGSAEAALENALRLDGSSWQARYLLGVIHQRAGRFDRALRAFDAVLEQRPADLPSLLRRGEILLRQRRLESARKAFERAVSQAPLSASAHYGLGRVLRAQKHDASAVSSFERALELQPHAVAVHHPLARALRRLGELEGARDHLGQAGDSSPVMDDPVLAQMAEQSVLARTFLVQADRARRRGLTGAAQRFYRRALELDPHDAGVHYNLGTLYGELGRLEDAERHFRAALENDPGRADAFYNLGVGLRARGRLQEAVGAFEEAGRLEPENAETRLELAVTLWAVGRREEARADLRRVVDAERDADLTERLVRYVSSMPEAGVDLDALLGDAVDRWPDAPALRAAWARGLGAAGSYAEAIEGLEPFLAGSDDEELLGVAALLLATAPEPLRDGDRALALAERLPDGAEKREMLAMSHAAGGRFEEAARLQTALLADAAAAGAAAELMRRLEENLRRYQDGRVAPPLR